MHSLQPILIALFLLLSPFAPRGFASETGDAGLRLVQQDGPAGAPVLLRPSHPVPAPVLQTWLQRVGAKKGVRDLALAEAAAAAPDIAVLARGAFEQWNDLLAGMREPFVLVEPDSVAALVGTKPVLIVPAGGLAGTSGSGFFKAGLASYVREGGTLVCLAQQSGSDLSSLPVPSGQLIEGAGWAEDPSPYFGVSFVKTAHPLLARVASSAPRIETSGHLRTVPAGSRVLLSRSDGRPTLVVYPFGAGRVVVTSLFSDLLSGMGYLGREEEELVRDLVLWAKAAGSTASVAPGDPLTVPLTLRGGAQDAAGVKISFIGSGGPEAAAEQIVSVPVKARQTVPLPLAFMVPPDVLPGIYHFEYTLLDQKNRKVSPPAELAEGRMAIGTPPVADVSAVPFPPQEGAVTGTRIRANIAPADQKMLLTIDVETDAAAAPVIGTDLLLRLPGREVRLALENGRVRTVIDLTLKEAERPTPLSLYTARGMLLSRHMAPPAAAGAPGITFDRSSYAPGKTMRVTMRGIGSGELMLTGAGQIENAVLPENGSMNFPVPDNLPLGAYPIAWELHGRGGKNESGLAGIDIEGYRLVCRGASVSPAPAAPKESGAAGAVLNLHATKALTAAVTLTLQGPDGTIVPAGETALELRKGDQEVRLPLPVRTEQAGIWALSAAISIALPDGPGLPQGNTPLASCQALFDRGTAAILGVATERPYYEDPAESLNAIVYLSADQRSTLLLQLDGKKAYRERIELPGLQAVKTVLRSVKPGAHTLRAELSGDGPSAMRETNVVNGTNLPDLVPSVVSAEPAAAVIDIGIGVLNQGKAPSAKSRAALYDGDPDSDGRLIGKADIPPLAPGQKHVAIMKWSLLKRTGERRLVVLADTGSDIAETNKKNNRSEFALLVPDFLLNIALEKKEFGVNEPVNFSLNAVNLTDIDRKDLKFSIALQGADEQQLSAETVPLAELPAAKAASLQRQFAPKTALPPGAYLITAVLTSGTDILANTLGGINITPVLSLAGSLEGPPDSAVFCRPLSVRYSVRDAGNVPATSGALALELAGSAAGAKPALAKQLPFTFGPKTFTLDRLEVPAGAYTLALKAIAENKERRMQRDQVLAQQPLVVAGAVTAAPFTSAFTRALIWTGRLGGLAAQALSENILRQAFQGEQTYVKVVYSPEEFTAQAMSGIYNVFVLFEVGDPLQEPRWLKDLAGQGQGMVIIGADEPAQAAAGVFGFTFGEPIARNGAGIVIADRPGMGLAGTIPASGAVLSGKKKGAIPLAFKAGSREAAALLDAGGQSGKVVVLPFSLLRSARDSGTGDIYGLLLRAIVHEATPEHEGAGELSAGGFTLTSSAGQVKARVVVTLPEKTHILWSSRETDLSKQTAVFDLTAGPEPQTVLYLHTPAESAQAKPITEIFTECGGNYISQGKLE